MGKLVEGYGIGVVLPSADIKGLFKVSDHGAAIYLLPVSDPHNKGWPEYPLSIYNIISYNIQHTYNIHVRPIFNRGTRYLVTV